MFLPSATDLGMQPSHLPTLLTHLAEALAASVSPWAGARLSLLPDKGLAHAHVRLAGTGVLARIPKQSQLNLAPQHNLAYQRACFERAEPSGRTPALRGWLRARFPALRDVDDLVQECYARLLRAHSTGPESRAAVRCRVALAVRAAVECDTC